MVAAISGHVVFGPERARMGAINAALDAFDALGPRKYRSNDHFR